MTDKVWDCRCIDDEYKRLLLDGIRSELRYNERDIERCEKLVEQDSPACYILLNSAQTTKNKLVHLKDKIESMTLCEMDGE